MANANFREDGLRLEVIFTDESLEGLDFPLKRKTYWAWDKNGRDANIKILTRIAETHAGNIEHAELIDSNVLRAWPEAE